MGTGDEPGGRSRRVFRRRGNSFRSTWQAPQTATTRSPRPASTAGLHGPGPRRPDVQRHRHHALTSTPTERQIDSLGGWRPDQQGAGGHHTRRRPGQSSRTGDRAHAIRRDQASSGPCSRCHRRRRRDAAARAADNHARTGERQPSQPNRWLSWCRPSLGLGRGGHPRSVRRDPCGRPNLAGSMPWEPSHPMCSTRSRRQPARSVSQRAGDSERAGCWQLGFDGREGGITDSSARLYQARGVETTSISRLGPRYPVLVGRRNADVSYGSQNEIYRVMGRALSEWVRHCRSRMRWRRTSLATGRRQRSP